MGESAYLLSDGRILVPRLALGSGVRGDGLVALRSDHPDARAWREYYESRGMEMPKATTTRYDEMP